MKDVIRRGWRAVCGLVTCSLASVGSSATHAQQRGAAASLVFENVTVVDVERGELVPGQRVVVVGNRIQAMGRAEAVNTPKQAQVIEARGKYLIPGLWDLHTHAKRMTDFFYPFLLANGVTGIRDAGSEVPLDTLHQWRDEILAGQRVGPPRQLLSGRFISEEGVNGAPRPCRRDAMTEGSHQTCVAAQPSDLAHVIDSLKAAGIDMLKTYGLSRAMYFAVAAEARRQGVPFGGHAGLVSALEASDSGARILDHPEMAGDLDARCIWDTDPQLSPLAELSGLRRRRPFAASLEECRPVAERFRRNGTWWVPTIAAYNGIGGTGARPIVEQFRTYTRQFWSESVANPYAPAQAGGAPAFTVRPPALGARGLLHLVQDLEVPILAGTDVIAGNPELPGFALHAELATYVAEGLTPLRALQTATLNPAKMLGGTDSLGRLAAGKLADLVLLDANPLEDITNTTRIRAVVANGRFFDRTALDQLMVETHSRIAAMQGLSSPEGQVEEAGGASDAGEP